MDIGWETSICPRMCICRIDWQYIWYRFAYIAVFRRGLQCKLCLHCRSKGLRSDMVCQHPIARWYMRISYYLHISWHHLYIDQGIRICRNSAYKLHWLYMFQAHPMCHQTGMNGMHARFHTLCVLRCSGFAVFLGHIRELLICRLRRWAYRLGMPMCCWQTRLCCRSLWPCNYRCN